jgi:23S rRNA (adenine2503-C2)-methyltransferase
MLERSGLRRAGAAVMSGLAMVAPRQIAGMTRGEFARAAGLPAREANAVYRRALTEGVFDDARLSGGAFALSLPRVARRAREAGEHGVTTKVALRLHDGLEAEMVHIPMGRGRHTLCISSQVGCKMGCRFCETARLGLLRPMAPHEVVGQLLVARHVLGLRFERVVFQGMGEPLDRPDILARVLGVLTDEGGLAMPHDHITVCTVGVAEGIRALAALGMKRLNLSLSLNAADDALRRELMPVARRTSLAELAEALVAYRQRANFQLGVHYCLLPGLNDRREHARDVARFCAPLGRVLVSVIPYNPGTEPLTRAPEEDEVARFVGWLRDEGLRVRRRMTKGRGVMGACGQLGNPALRGDRRRLPVRLGR